MNEPQRANERLSMPITSSEFDQLMSSFAPFESIPVVLVAVSGGPDSMALALLSNEWAVNHGGKAIAVTVDHQLREKSADEAQQVKLWLEAKGMEHHILTWTRNDGNVLSSGVQATARKARYQMLSQWCLDNNVKHLLTAHQAQDQLETFMIRLAKGSGLRGLTSIQNQVHTNFGRILRPLITIDPDRIKATLKAFNQPYVVDPSNLNENFTRVRWRHLLPSLKAEGLTPLTLQESLERLNHAQRLIDQCILNLLKKYAVIEPYGYLILKKEALHETPEAFEEILSRLLSIMRLKDYPIRRQSLIRAISLMKNGRSLTLSGCQIINKANEWWIVREPSAMLNDVPVPTPGTYFWDGRFAIEVSETINCRISALGKQGILKLNPDARKSFRHIPHIVLQTLPALWKEDDLIKALPPLKFTPHFDYFSKKEV